MKYRKLNTSLFICLCVNAVVLVICNALSTPNSNNLYNNIRIDPPEFFQDGIEWVVQQAFMAIDCVLNDKNFHGIGGRRDHLLSLQPQNRGRIGIEVDGVRYLLTSEMKRRCFERIYAKYLNVNRVTKYQEEVVHVTDTTRRVRPTDDKFLEDFGLRVFSFMLATKLSQELSIKTLEDESLSNSSPVPVAIYFRDIEGVVQASTDLQIMKEFDGEQGLYDNISICHLGDSKLPSNLGRNDDLESENDRRERRSSGLVAPANGVAIIVQPFYRDMENLQRISMISAVKSIPLILVSPRLENNIETECSELASSYGGEEPARHPWFLKDFLPPAFAWVVDATVKKDTSTPQISLTRSVNDKDHAWHLFYSKRVPVPIEQYNERTSKLCNIEHHYFASIPASTGRPSSELMLSLWKDWRNRIKSRQFIGE